MPDKNKYSGYTRVPLYRELGINSFDFMSLLKAVTGRGNCIFLESAGRTKKKGRFSYLCFNPAETVAAFSSGVRVERGGGTIFHEGVNIFSYIEGRLKLNNSPADSGFGDFNGGYVGYFSGVSSSVTAGPTCAEAADDGLPCAEFLLIDEFIVFDNHTGRYHLSTARYPGGSSEIISEDHGRRRLDELEMLISELISGERVHFIRSKPAILEIKNSTTDEKIIRDIEAIRNRILDGEIHAGSVSKNFHVHGTFSAYNFYHKLRGIAPAPYMYYMNLSSCRLAGSSPETFLKIKGRSAMMKPSSALVHAPSSKKEKAAARRELSRSQEERALHTIVVDIARNGLASFAVPGSVKVKRLMDIEEYHGMLRIVSGINALMPQGLGVASAAGCILTMRAPWTAACSSFTGYAGHMRQMEHGSGIAGYFGFNSSCDTCVISGSAIFRDGSVSVGGFSPVTAWSSQGDVIAALDSSAGPALGCLGYAL